jgi:hypothetical protein
MKKIFTLLAAIFLMAHVWAQSPYKMSYQAVIRNGSNDVVTTQVRMRISILQGSDVGTAAYVETQTTTPNANGLVTVEIGAGTPVTGTIAAIDWAAGPYYIKTETDPLGGTSYTIDGTAQILSVPYALYAKTAESAVSGTSSLIHYIGELYGGGIIVSVWKTGGVEHGLVASLTDISPAAAWSDITNAAAGAISNLNGQSNTGFILLQSATAPAALLCSSHSGGGNSDWYLPSIWELKECYNAGYIVNSILGPTDGFKFAAYWSSTENSATQGWYLLFNTGILGSDAAKGNNGIVRAVRKF